MLTLNRMRIAINRSALAPFAATVPTTEDSRGSLTDGHGSHRNDPHQRRPVEDNQIPTHAVLRSCYAGKLSSYTSQSELDILTSALDDSATVA